MTKLAILLVTLATSLAIAGPKQKQEAKKHVDRATKLHKDGKFDEALVELQAAYKLDPDVDLLYAIGQVYSKLGRCDDAATSFREFAKQKKKQPDVAQVVDEAIKACTPAAPPAPPPEPAVVVAPPPEPTPPPAPTPPPTPPSTPPPAPPSTAPIVVAPPPVVVDSRMPWYRDVAGDVLVLGGVAAAVTGLVVYQSARADLDAAVASSMLTRYDQLVSDAHGKRTISLVLVGGGLALVGVGLVHYVVHGSGHETHGLALAPAQGGGLVTWSGGF